jgi:hypothetical protein
VSPLSSSFGVEVHGVDLSEPISAELGAEMRVIANRYELASDAWQPK